VQWLADRFYNSDYNISKLMEDIFTSDWFYDEKNIGVRIKSPIELIAGIRRMLPMKLQNEESHLLGQIVLWQVLFYPPNVAGWPGGKNWIDSSTLMMRMRLPQMFNDTDEFNVKPKADDDQMMGRMDDEKIKVYKGKAMGKIGKPINAEISWSNYLKNFDSVKKDQLINTIQNSLLQIKPGYNENVIQSYTDNDSKENFVKTATIQIMSTPEYQMC